MIDFVTGQGGNVIGAYPSVKAKNTSGAGATDGTALLANWVTNLWGFVQDAMQRAALTPSGVAEEYAAETGSLPLGTTSTQIRTALQMAHGSPGELVLWCRSQSPATVGARILLLQGQTITIANYKDLVAACYCGDGVNNTAGVPFYKSSDAGGVTRDTAGAYFTLPDARGVTLRGIDAGATRDPDGATRGAGTPNGSIQQDAFQGHRHQMYRADSNADTGNPVYPFGANEAQNFASSGLPSTIAMDADNVQEAITDTVNGTPRTSSESRMWNLATYIGIRY